MLRVVPMVLLLLAPALSSGQPAVASQGVDALQRRWTLLEAHRARLEQLLAAQVRRISRLKRQPRGVRRDYQLRGALRANQQLASRLTKLQGQIRELNRKLVDAYDRAIRRSKDPTERARLRARRDQLNRRASPRSRIVTGEQESDLDSAEDLEEKADLLKDSEEKVRKQLRVIQRQINRLQRRARLKRHSRAVDDSPFVEDSPRRLAQAKGKTGRSTGRVDDHSEPNSAGADPDLKTNTPAPPPGPSTDSNAPAPGGFSGSGGKQSGGAGECSGSGCGTPSGGGGYAMSPNRSSGGELSVTIRGVMDPSILRELQKARRSGSVKQRVAALKKARRRLEQVARKLNAQSKKLRKRAKSIH